MKKLVFFLFITLSIAGFYSCANNGCTETRETFCFIDLKSTSGDTLKSVNVWYNDQQYSAETSPRSIEIILNPDATSSIYRMEMSIGGKDSAYQVTDTLSIQYEAFPYLLNMECGCTVYFSISEATSTHHFLKDISLKNQDITNEEDVNICIEY